MATNGQASRSTAKPSLSPSTNYNKERRRQKPKLAQPRLLPPQRAEDRQTPTLSLPHRIVG